jgi:DNA-binding FadR family transcriptional regulator
MITIEAMIASKTNKGMVVLKWGKESGVLTPDEARAHALKILECADSAESDEFLFWWLEHRVGIEEISARLAMLKDFRTFRDAKSLAGVVERHGKIYQDGADKTKKPKKY